MPLSQSLSLVLPCYNEEENAERTIGEVLEWMESEGIDGEVLAVDDGSKDRTGQILDDLAKNNTRLRVIHHEKNQGYGLAIRTGCDAASKDVIGFMDSDGQFHVEDISLLLAHINRFEFVTGRRRHRADPFVRNMFGKVLGVMNWVMFGLWVRDVNCGMKIFTRRLWPSIRPTHGVEKLFNTEMFLRLKEQGIAWYQVDVPHYPRVAGSPTGAKVSVILRMFKELFELKRAKPQRLAAIRAQ